MQMSVGKLTLLLCVVWAGSLIYGEMIAYWISYWTCSWPSFSQQSSMGSTPIPGEVRVVVIADPQLEDRTSHGLSPGTFALKSLEFLTDIYMRRSFRTSVLSFEPDEIIFLGDYFNGGPNLSDIEWQESLNRFQHVFDQSQRGTKSGSRNIPVHYISGNHDIGYSGHYSMTPGAVERYKEIYGESNYLLTIGHVEFIAVDAQTLDGSSRDNLTSASWNFIQRVSQELTSPWRVILTHIPLYRRDGTHCGPYRSSPIINQRVKRLRYQSDDIIYQNYLTEKTSEKLLTLLKPILVLSGHDHDQCTIVHRSSSGHTTEHTLGTFNWQLGNLYPSFMLVSVSSSSQNASSDGIVLTRLCFLPFQTHIYLWYASLFVITLLLLLVWPTSGVNICYSLTKLKERFRSSIGSNLQGALKEKDEDANNDYDIVWDSEGVMHLIRKNYSKSPVADSGTVHSGRGSAVVRTAARKQTVEEPDNSVVVVETQTSEQVVRAPKAAKGKVIFLVQRMLRIFFQISIIAVFNIPLYIILLAKDWI